jgi:hypothetical protein
MPITLSDRRSNRGATRYLIRSLLFLAALAALGAFFQRPLTAAFLTNPYLNGTIAAAFLFGASYTFKALLGTLFDVRAAEQAANVALKARRRELPLKQADEALLGNARRRGVSDFLHKVHRVIGHGDATATLPYLLDSLATRGDDQRALVRYLVGALVLLGLIGTFYGLLLTIAGVRDVIGGLSTEKAADTMTLIANFKDRLAAPLGGMGTSFSASLFGSAGGAGAGLSGTATVPRPERSSRPVGGAGGQRSGAAVAAGGDGHRSDRNDFTPASRRAAASDHRPAGASGGDHRVSGQSR